MNLLGFLAFVRRRLVPILVCLVASVLASVYITASSAKTYRATTRLFVSIPAARGVQEALQGVQLSSQLLQSYARIATSRAAATRISDKLEGQLSPGEIRPKLTATPQPDTLLIDISATDGDPTSARDVANAAADVLASFVGELESGKEGAIEARVIDPAVTPRTPISPKPLTNLSLGALLGLGVGLAAALLLEAGDQSISQPAEAVAATGVPVLALIPRHRRLGSKPLVAAEPDAGGGSEAYRSLRTAVRFADRSAALRTLVVTSPGEGEGKSVTAANLAVAFAQSGERVVIIDADLRRSRVASIFGLQPEPGVTAVLAGTSALDNAMQLSNDLHVLTAGGHPGNASELVGSEAMVAMLESLAGRADIVIIDTPPVLPVTDAVVLSALADAVILVLDQGHTTRGAADEAAHRLDSVGATLVGTVLNGVRSRGGYGRADSYTAKPARGASR